MIILNRNCTTLYVARIICNMGAISMRITLDVFTVLYIWSTFKIELFLHFKCSFRDFPSLYPTVCPNFDSSGTFSVATFYIIIFLFIFILELIICRFKMMYSYYIFHTLIKIIYLFILIHCPQILKGYTFENRLKNLQ